MNIDNLTALILGIISFNPPISVARLLNGKEIIINSTVLPFAIPIGYWDDFLRCGKICYLGMLILNTNKDLTDEHYFNMTLPYSNGTLNLWMVWDGQRGTLEAMIIKVVINDFVDLLDIRLSGLKLSRENAGENFIKIMLGMASAFIFIIALVVIASSIIPFGSLKFNLVSLNRRKSQPSSSFTQTTKTLYFLIKKYN